MHKKITLKTLILLVILAFTATTVLAADSPYLTASFWMADSLDPPAGACSRHPTRRRNSRLVVARHGEPERNRPAQRKPIFRSDSYRILFLRFENICVLCY